MEKVVRKFRTHAEAEHAEREYYRALTPEQRLDILLDLVKGAQGETEPRLERVYRIVKLGAR